jgi:hypothetical protein
VNATLSGAQIPSGNVWITSEGGCVIAVAGKISAEQAAPLLSSFARHLQGICRLAP